MTERQRLEAAIAALEGQRSTLGDAVVEPLLAAASATLAALGAGAAPLPSPEPALRQVSIVFLDVVGSTTLAQRLDPEAIGVVMDDALARGTAVVQAHAGRVLQYAGDSILAAFGADEAREDDAERAVRCGLDLLELGRTIGAEVRVAHGHEGLDVRVGIHTGAVLLGAGIDADGSIRGIAVNIAARMEQTAPAGALRISRDTHDQVRGLFEVEPQAPLAVKGVDEPVRSFLVTRARPRSFRTGSRGIEGVATRMIGRDAELEALQDAFKRLFDDRRLAAVTVVADAGIGKSRLLAEFSDWCDAQGDRVVLLRGRATPQTQGQPFGLLRDIVAGHFRIADDDSVEAARRKMEEGIVRLLRGDGEDPDPTEAHAHLLGHLIGIEWRDSRHLEGILDDAKQIRNRAFHAAAQLFRRVGTADGSPVVLALEDLHWADPESLDFLTYLAEVDRDVPLLIVACSRPTLFERRARWCADAVHRRLDLQPLGRDMSRMLAGELLKKLHDIPAALRELVIGGAEGNPFYMEELVKMLIDQGAIETGDAWTVNAERLLLTKVPPTLTGVLQARLDGLPAPERLTLQQASVIGPVFWDRALIALDTNAGEALPALVRRELALPRADSTGDDLREYAFKHQILHQVTYETVLKRTRRELHGKLARWLAAQTGLRANDFLGAAARHFELAGDAANAAEYHARAAEHARARLAHDAVLEHVQRALALMEGSSAAGARSLRWRLLDAREATLEIQGDRAGQRADIDAMAELAEADGDDRRRAHAAWRRSALAHRLADHAAMEAAATQAVEWARRADDAELRLLAQRMQAMSLAFQGQPAEGRVIAQRTLDEARALSLWRIEGTCLNALGIIAGLEDDEPEALRLDQESLVAYRRAGDRRNEAIAHGNIGAGWIGVGELAQARRELEECVRLMRINGERALEVSPLCALATLALWQGDDAQALAQARSAVDTAIAVEAPDHEAAAWCRVGEAELALGRHAEAARAFATAQERAMRVGSPYRHDAAAGLARVALADGDTGAAMRALQPLLEPGTGAPALGGAEFPRVVEWTCHRVLARAGDPRAIEWLSRAHDALRSQAATMSDAARREGFLGNIPVHREIAAAWKALRPQSAPSRDDR